MLLGPSAGADKVDLPKSLSLYASDIDEDSSPSDSEVSWAMCRVDSSGAAFGSVVIVRFRCEPRGFLALRLHAAFRLVLLLLLCCVTCATKGVA